MGNLQKGLPTAILTNAGIYSDWGVIILWGAGEQSCEDSIVGTDRLVQVS